MRADALASGKRDRVAVVIMIVPLTTPTNSVLILHMASAQYSEKQGVMEERSWMSACPGEYGSAAQY